MGEVYLDGERVDFQGAPPSSVGAAWELVGNYLASQERVVGSTRVDGEDWDPDRNDDQQEWGRTEFRSVELGTKLVELALSWAGRRSEKRQQLDLLAGEALTRSWQQTRDQVFDVFQGLRPLVEQFGTLLSFGEARAKEWTPELMERYGATSKALERTLAAVEDEDCARLSDLLADELAPAVDALLLDAARLLKGEAKGDDSK